MTPIPLTETQMAELFRLRAENAALKDQIKQLRIEADFNFEQYQDAGRLMFELKEITEQQAEAIRMKDAAIAWIQKRCAGDAMPNWENTPHTGHSRGLILDRTNHALAIQPSSDILQARDEKVQRQAYERAAEVCEHFAENGVCHTNYPEEAFAGDCAVAIRALIKGDGK
jgi:hypothetical protein